jgi:hypothetical protein
MSDFTGHVEPVNYSYQCYDEARDERVVNWFEVDHFCWVRECFERGLLPVEES